MWVFREMIPPKILKDLKRKREARSMMALNTELGNLMREPNTTVQDLIDLLESRKTERGLLNEVGFDFSSDSVYFQFNIYGLDK